MVTEYIEAHSRHSLYFFFSTCRSILAYLHSLCCSIAVTPPASPSRVLSTNSPRTPHPPTRCPALLSCSHSLLRTTSQGCIRLMSDSIHCSGRFSTRALGAHLMSQLHRCRAKTAQSKVGRFLRQSSIMWAIACGSADVPNCRLQLHPVAGLTAMIIPFIPPRLFRQLQT